MRTDIFCSKQPFLPWVVTAQPARSFPIEAVLVSQTLDFMAGSTAVLWHAFHLLLLFCEVEIGYYDSRAWRVSLSVEHTTPYVLGPP